MRDAGKPVLAYATGYTDDSYQLAAAPRKSGSTRWARSRSPGRAASNLYYKGLLDKLGVTANVYRVGTYKSAVEPFIRNDMSPEAQQNYQALARRCSRAGARASRRGAARRRKVDAVPERHAGGGRGRRRRPRQGRAGRRAGRQDRRAARVRSAARRSSAARMTTAPGGYQRIKLAAYVGDAVDETPDGPDRRRHHRRR